MADDTDHFPRFDGKRGIVQSLEFLLRLRRFTGQAFAGVQQSFLEVGQVAQLVFFSNVIDLDNRHIPRNFIDLMGKTIR
ncbi:hypothetical protein [Methylocaldum sp. MU1018]